MTTQIIKTTCPYCGVGCGVDAKVENNQLIAVSGSKDHPANKGSLCVKGASLHETVGYQDRILHPTIKNERVSWDRATHYIAEQLSQVIEQHGPEAIAMYVSGQILTEDYYVANKLMKGFIGTANIDTNSRLCMASAVVAHKRAFGSDTVPACYEDIEHADLVVLTGSNLAWAHPILYQRLSAAKQARPHMKIVVIDPRQTASCDIADLHLALRPGTDAYLYNGLAQYLIEHGYIDHNYINSHCNGYEDLLKQVSHQTLSDTSHICDLEDDLVSMFYQWFAETERTVTLFSQGINQSSSGVDKGNAIINCHLITGKIGKVGAAPFSITGQPNAMGGREVGGLANQLAAHMTFSNPQDIDQVGQFWHATSMAQQEGLKAVDMFEAVAQGKIKAIWIIATNPLVSMPDSESIREALTQCDLVIVQDVSLSSDTLKYADVCLPATTWGEKSGTVTNSERTISRQRSFLTPPGEARHDWQIICDIAKEMGFNEAFSYKTSADIFREHAQLSALRNSGNRDFDISELSLMSDQAYDNMPPIQWPINSAYPKGRARFFEDGVFFTADRKANLIPIQPKLPAYPATHNELILNTGRIRDQWHTMTRTGKTSRLLAHTSVPFVEIHPATANAFNIQENSWVSLQTPVSKYIAKATITRSVRQDSVFIPMHWSDFFSSHGKANSLVRPIRDALSGQPEFKHSPVEAKSLNPRSQGVLISSLPFSPPSYVEWHRIPYEHCTLWELMSEGKTFTLSGLKAYYPRIKDWVSITDSNENFLHAAGFIDKQLTVLLFSAINMPSIDQPWLLSQMGKTIPLLSRHLLLTGVPQDSTQACGKIVCSCHQVGENTIINTLANGNACDIDTLGELLKCGTQCGSCVPELKSLINLHQA
ncbi:nitrate reductase [Neptunomonas concharum]|uniref:Nitrate reductase n=1 Tax=Neptunomonas concharum TaxID=1031538 RepID=A0A5P1RCY6_9GAMM|nr:nitrate reductase [Neptunomonas concharum]QEQ97111.1 nitrate reductase [Neptunomonas concharum]